MSTRRRNVVGVDLKRWQGDRTVAVCVRSDEYPRPTVAATRSEDDFGEDWLREWVIALDPDVVVTEPWSRDHVYRIVGDRTRISAVRKSWLGSTQVVRTMERTGKLRGRVRDEEIPALWMVLQEMGNLPAEVGFRQFRRG